MRERFRQWQLSDAAPAITAIVVTLAIVALSALLVFLSPQTPLVGIEVRNADPNRLPAFFSLGVVLIAAWGLTLGRRCTDTTIRLYLRAIVILLAFLMGVSLLIGRITSQPAANLICYSRYLALLFIPLLLFMCMLHETAPEERRVVHATQTVLFLVAELLFLFVMFNDYHHLVFQPNSSPSTDPWRYGPLYPVYLVWVVALVGTSLILLAWKARDERPLLPLFFIVTLGGLVHPLYVFVTGQGASLGAASASMTLFFFAAVEVGMMTGLLPSARRYDKLFRYLPLDLKILNNRGVCLYRTAVARTLDNTTLFRLVQSAPADTYEVASIRSETNPDAVYKLYRLEAGISLLTLNASGINARKRDLQEHQEQLIAQNSLLIRNHAMRSITYRQARERELYERVEHDLSATVTNIRQILDQQIPEAESEDARLQQMNLVKVLVAYCKRKGMLALAAAESDTMNGDQLTTITREAMADLHSIGIECAVLVNATVPPSIADVNATYDCFYDCIISVLPEAHPVVMTYLNMQPGNPLEMRLAIECALGISSENAVQRIPKVATSTEALTAMQSRIAQEIERRLLTRNVTFAIEMDEGLINVSVRACSAQEASSLNGDSVISEYARGGAQ